MSVPRTAATVLKDHDTLGLVAMNREGRFVEAIPHWRVAVELEPARAPSRFKQLSHVPI